MDGHWGSAEHHRRYMEPVDARSRRRCSCCRKRATHKGMANGMALALGCEFFMRRWVRDGTVVFIRRKDPGSVHR